MKKPEFALNAVFAKVRCLYGNRLTDKNYSELLNMRSVNEIAEYLKTKTAYSEIFEGLNTAGELHRARLEELLSNKTYNDLERVIRFQKYAGSDLYEYFIIKFDTVQLMNAMSSIQSGSSDYLFTFPVFYNERSKLDLYRLAQAKSYEALLKTAENTIYYDTLRSAVSKYRLTNNLTDVQSEFRNFTDREFIKLAAGKKKNTLSNKDELGSLYRTMKDIHLIKVLYRMIRFYVSGETSKNIAEPTLTGFTRRQFEELTNARTFDSLGEAVSKTYLSGAVSGKNGEEVFRSADGYLYKVLKNAVSRSNDPDTVMFAYFHLCDFEVKNIIHIIEGVRYGLPPSEIKPMLNGVSLSQ